MENTIFEKRDDKVRKIISVGINSADWLPLPENFFLGNEIGFNFGAHKVRANVFWDAYDVVVKMTSPTQNYTERRVLHPRQTFFVRNPPGVSLYKNEDEPETASSECIAIAKEMLVYLFSDWVILQCRKETIIKKLECFEIYASQLHLSEIIRITPLKIKLALLSRKSGELKAHLKEGKINQEEYKKRKRPLHEEIVSLMQEICEKDAFNEMFSEEIADCWFAKDKRAMIESFKD